MRFYTLKETQNANPTVYVSVADTEGVYALHDLGYDFASMNELLQSDIEIAEISERIMEQKPKAKNLRDMIICAPIPKPMQDVICLGLNYADHIEESKGFEKDKEEPAKAVYFSKRVNMAVADGEAIPSHRNLDEKLDYEVELAVVLKKDARNVKEADAWKYIFGYTIINDISARDLQRAHGQWFVGKSLDGFLPMGPCIVSEDEFTRPTQLNIRCYVNGELRQNSNTRMLITSVEKAISELSAGMTLLSGTIISMGTPSGVAIGMASPVFLQPGDTVCCEIEKIGTLTNTIVD